HTGFRPYDAITRQDAAVILCRALESRSKIADGSYSFADSDSVADYAKQSVASLASNGYFKGDGTNFYPYSNITRAETAAVIDRIYTSIR
ncbi:MAG: S-layer homology domain-containing protein, partial [Clostridia bacterium]|nr:S-layer homology domain-containing protein [Clostridia bacterium]